MYVIIYDKVDFRSNTQTGNARKMIGGYMGVSFLFLGKFRNHFQFN